MTEYIHLQGSEDVMRASHNIQQAAGEMSSAACNMQGAFEMHQRFMGDWLQRLQELLERKPDE